MMALSSRRFSSAFLLLVFGAFCAATAQEVPANDSCESATEITAFPFTDGGLLANATRIDSFKFTCQSPWEGSSVWYIFPDLAKGTEVKVSFWALGYAEVQGQILVSNDELGTCPNNFLCPAGLINMTSIVSPFGHPATSISMTTEADSFYYLVLFSTNSTIGSEFQVYANTADADTADDAQSQEELPVWSQEELPVNNLCESATDITILPFSDSGSLMNATEDLFHITSCYNYGKLRSFFGSGGTDVWYVLPDVSEGTKYDVSIVGIGYDVFGMVLKSNEYYGTCPEKFNCLSDKISANSFYDLSRPSRTWKFSWSAEKDWFYYLVLYSASNSTGQGFEVFVDTNPSTKSTGYKKVGSVVLLVLMALLTNVVV